MLTDNSNFKFVLAFNKHKNAAKLFNTGCSSSEVASNFISITVQFTACSVLQSWGIQVVHIR
mgnify:CR=1 FL=1